MLNMHSPWVEVLFWDFCSRSSAICITRLTGTGFSALQSENRVIFGLFSVILLRNAPSRLWHSRAKTHYVQVRPGLTEMSGFL